MFSYRLYKSTDAGVNWAPVGAGAFLDNSSNKLAGLAAIDDLVLAASANTNDSFYADWYYRGGDHSGSWTKVAGDGITAPQAYSASTKNIYYTMASPSVIEAKFYVLDHDRFVWRTADCVTWEKLGQLPASAFNDIWQSPTSKIIKFGGNLYAIGKDATSAQANSAGVRSIYISTDDGATWAGHDTDYSNSFWGGQSDVAVTATAVFGDASETVTGPASQINEIRKSANLTDWGDVAPAGFDNYGNNDYPNPPRFIQEILTSDGTTLALIDPSGGVYGIYYSSDDGASWTAGANPWGAFAPKSVYYVGGRWVVNPWDTFAYTTTDFQTYVTGNSSLPSDWRIAKGEYVGGPGTPAEPSFGEPQVMLDVSGNTRTFGMTQKWRSMGKTGEYDKRVIWRRLGQHRSFTPRIRISSPVKRAVFTAYAKIRPAR